MVNPIYNITPFTLLDYPGRTAAIIWFAGCNMRCSYCYNPDIVLGKGKVSYEEALNFLEKRKGLLEAVVLSGGECTLHRDVLPFAKEIKEKGFLLKIDTNGSNPDVLKALIEQGLVDYVAVDFKAPFNKFELITKSSLYNSFIQSLDLLQNSSVQFEVRTTVHSSLLTQNDVEEMCALLQTKNYQGNYYLQYALTGTPTLETLPASTGRIKTDINHCISSIPVVERN